MLRIKKQQIMALEQVAAADFMHRMLSYLRKEFPEEYESFGEAASRELIQHGIQRAEQYGVTQEYGVCLFVNMMIFFGRDFDKDLRLSWVQSMLIHSRQSGASVDMDRLYDMAIEHERHVVR